MLFFFYSEDLKRNNLKNIIASGFQKNKRAEFVKVKKIKMKKKQKIKNTQNINKKQQQQQQQKPTTPHPLHYLD